MSSTGRNNNSQLCLHVDLYVQHVAILGKCYNSRSLCINTSLWQCSITPYATLCMFASIRLLAHGAVEKAVSAVYTNMLHLIESNGLSMLGM